MALETIFGLCMAMATIGWLALAAAPLGRVYLVRTARIIAMGLALAYFIQLFTITQPVPNGSFKTLAGVKALFSLPGNVMLGWTHYLAFDLFVGSWAVEDAAKIGLAHWAILIPLALTFLVGPVGLFTYAVIRTIHMWRRHGRLMQ
jgi:Domain of unknown function (DUF4281)